MGMSPRQWDRVKELYEAALECDLLQRTAYVEKHENDEVVRGEVLRLLGEHDTLGSFLSTPAFVKETDPPDRIPEGVLLASRFRIINFIAAGGMGEVYKAEDTRLDRIVVLKFLPKVMADDRESMERFHREAQAASALNHPNICTVYDLGEEAGRAFIAMEYLEGETLSARIKKGALPVQEALEVAMAVASALNAAHRKGIVHRDLKPGNIMLTGGGAKLLDFGLAMYERPEGSTEGSTTSSSSKTSVAGTVPYMSPEQLRGQEVDARSDTFAFGVVLYEMLAGKRAFQLPPTRDSVAVISREEPRSLLEFVPDLPAAVERITQRCMGKRPEERYESMSDVKEALKECYALVCEPASGINLRVLLKRSKQPRVAISALLSLLMLVATAGWWIHRSSRARWAQDQVPQIAKLIEQEKFGEAYFLAVQTERYIPSDPMLARFWPEISWSGSIHTIPAGASVFRRSYNSPKGVWEFVGRSPIENHRFPREDSQWKFELKGFATVERATFPDDSLTLTMDKKESAPTGMVHVQLPTSESNQRLPIRLYGFAGFEMLPTVPLDDYWIDRFEVTNAEYKQFVDHGGYQKPEYWKHGFVTQDKVLSWADAMKLFVDKTGRSGPATWMAAEYPTGQADYPVTGVSWFEAAAYAEFAGKSLPTIYHWKAAASPRDSPSMIPASNFSRLGPARVGSYQGMSWCGVYDMAGNVKEWCANEAAPGKRYVLGGGWDEQSYLFNNPDAQSPFERSSDFGFRCARYVLTGDSSRAADPVTLQARDLAHQAQISNQLFNAYKSLYSYDKTPMNAVVESSQETEDWKVEKITFDAAYGRERMAAYLFLPKNASPPFQAVVHFPGAGAVRTRSSNELFSEYLDSFDFIIKTGRAVMFPLYKSTFERGDGLNFTYPNATNSYRDHVIAWSKDLSRSIDYLETRLDIDHERIAYEGYSWGAAMGSLLPAMENRLKALVLIGPGIYLQQPLPEADQVTFAPRVKVPALMLNGRFDFIFPAGPSQEPMFRLLGTSTQHKRRVVYDTGHDVPRNEMIKESLDWLDRYLGPIK